MKVAVYKDFRGEYRSYGVDCEQPSEGVMTFIGYEERNIEKPKKTVRKEADCTDVYAGQHKFQIPTNAKNVKCTYEIEE